MCNGIPASGPQNIRKDTDSSPPMIQRYVSKISGPLLDRIDIHIEVPAVKYKELRAPSSSEDSAAVRLRVIAAGGPGKRRDSRGKRKTLLATRRWRRR